MKKILLIILLLSASAFPSLSRADLDLEQEILVIPDTHNEKPYIWNVRLDPGGYELTMENKSLQSGTARFLFDIKGAPSSGTGEMHVLITDEDLHTFVHIRPVKTSEGRYSFNFDPSSSGRYRFEIVFKTADGWINLRKNIKLQKSEAKPEKTGKQGDEDYEVKVKLYPRKLYSKHVSTFLYQIGYKGKPLKDIEKIDGADMQVAAWDEDLKEFIFMTPQQNLGGPEVGVSMVFMRPGRHAVFAEFKHNGIVRRIDFVVNVNDEIDPKRTSLPYLGPSE